MRSVALADHEHAGAPAIGSMIEPVSPSTAALLVGDHARTAAREATAPKATAAAAAGGLVFEIDRALSRFEDVHTALRPGGPG
jgi:hypothetical protein